MQIANTKSINIKGAVLLIIKASGIKTHLMVYVSPDVQGLYLLNYASMSFTAFLKTSPSPGEVESTDTATVSQSSKETMHVNKTVRR